jgi:hypothetical protein
MNREHAEQLAGTYFTACLERDEDNFLSVLNNDVIIEEC